MHQQTFPRLRGLREVRPTACADSASPALDLLLDAAEQFAPGTRIGISGVDGDAITTLVASDSLVYALDQLQHDRKDGPTLTAVEGGLTVIVDDAITEQRWPAFTRSAVEMGLRSILALPLVIGERTLGGLSMYSTSPTALSAESLAFASMFATQAAIIVAQAQREKDLLLAVQTSTATGKSVGLVMERFCIDDEEAAAYLRRLARASGMSVYEISSHFVDQANDLWHSAEEDQSSSGASNVTRLMPASDRRYPDQLQGPVPAFPAPTRVDEQDD